MDPVEEWFQKVFPGYNENYKVRFLNWLEVKGIVPETVYAWDSYYQKFKEEQKAGEFCVINDPKPFISKETTEIVSWTAKHFLVAMGIGLGLYFLIR